jgi:hypothetical protein
LSIARISKGLGALFANHLNLLLKQKLKTAQRWKSQRKKILRLGFRFFIDYKGMEIGKSLETLVYGFFS